MSSPAILAGLCLIPVVWILAAWGFGSMVFAIAKVRGFDAKRSFWISAVSYALMLSVLSIACFAEFALDSYDSSSALLILIYLVAGFGVLIAPFIGLAIRKRTPGLFKPPAATKSPHPSNIPVTPKAEPVIQKTQASTPFVETILETKPEPVPLRAMEPKMELSHVFVSYRRSDSADIAGRIYDRLIGKFGKGPIFKDVDSIPLGFDFKEYLDMKVGECDVLLAIIGNEWLTTRDSSGERRLDDPTDFVRIEIEAALERNIPVIPLLVRDAHMPRAHDLPPSLQKLVYRNGTPIRSDPDFHRDMDRLIAYLEKYVNNDTSS